VRYLLLFEAMLRQGRLSYGEIRDRETGRLQVLTYAALLWQLFRSLIEGALDGLVRELGRKVINKVLAAIDQGVESFLEERCKSRRRRSPCSWRLRHSAISNAIRTTRLSPKCQLNGMSSLDDSATN
jgi:hypothetical protein